MEGREKGGWFLGHQAERRLSVRHPFLFQRSTSILTAFGAWTFPSETGKDAHPLGDPGQGGQVSGYRNASPTWTGGGQRVLISRDTPCSPQLHLSFFKKKVIYLFTIWLHQLSVAACGIFLSFWEIFRWAPEHVGSGVLCRLTCPKACGILVLPPGIKPVSPAFQGRFLTAGPPRKSLHLSLNHPFFSQYTQIDEKRKSCIVLTYGKPALFAQIDNNTKISVSNTSWCIIM